MNKNSSSGNLQGNNLSTNQSTQQSESVTPRDVRILRLIFNSHGIESYQDHVPLQLMDFAYRYTTSVLKDAVIFNDHANAKSSSISSAGNSGSALRNLTIDDVRLSIAARTNYQFKPNAPKELLLQIASEKNKKPLPPIMPTWGIRLPPEKYCLTARESDLNDDLLLDSDMEDEEMEDNHGDSNQ
ncbi:chromatin modification protein [Ascoidea rubescens DSM 1968]|uniref:TFIID-31kDa-domain-containing protein n=1 Tax=Ascoidea rubescens DSM 1968 TaxID=1344418 RepID=A0A1D2VMS9_9ASCO|nr:TFIID-31kDa-domain-containing protein [Ascoidea rubescens DSM 1968]ODV62910.1 TFIID-31kDa-domain-containing protein [Ascoidea rubescens DSM 1968]